LQCLSGSMEITARLIQEKRISKKMRIKKDANAKSEGLEHYSDINSESFSVKKNATISRGIIISFNQKRKQKEIQDRLLFEIFLRFGPNLSFDWMQRMCPRP
jgi:hypothetical protein